MPVVKGRQQRNSATVIIERRMHYWEDRSSAKRRDASASGRVQRRSSSRRLSKCKSPLMGSGGSAAQVDQCLAPTVFQLSRLSGSRAARRCLMTATASCSPTSATSFRHPAASLFIAMKSAASVSSSAPVYGVLRSLAGLSQSGSEPGRALGDMFSLALMGMAADDFWSQPPATATCCQRQKQSDTAHRTADATGQLRRSRGPPSVLLPTAASKI